MSENFQPPRTPFVLRLLSCYHPNRKQLNFAFGKYVKRQLMISNEYAVDWVPLPIATKCSFKLKQT